MQAAQEFLSRMRYGEARRSQMEQFGISRTTATRDLSEAMRLMELDADEERPALRAIAVARLSRIMDKAEAAGKFEAAIRAQREITRITGIAAPIKVESSTRPSAPPELMERLEELSDEELDVAIKLGLVEQ